MFNYIYNVLTPKNMKHNNLELTSCVDIESQEIIYKYILKPNKINNLSSKINIDNYYVIFYNDIEYKIPNLVISYIINKTNDNTYPIEKISKIYIENEFNIDLTILYLIV